MARILPVDADVDENVFLVPFGVAFLVFGLEVSDWAEPDGVDSEVLLGQPQHGLHIANGNYVILHRRERQCHHR